METKLSKYFKRHDIKFTPWGIKNNISPSTIYRHLNGKGSLSPENAKRISEATFGEVSVLDLLFSKRLTPCSGLRDKNF